MMPADVCKEIADEGQLSSTLQENFHEVLNVVAGLLNVGGAPRVRLSQFCNSKEELPEAAAALCAEPPLRVVYDVSVDGYGTGTITLYLS